MTEAPTPLASLVGESYAVGRSFSGGLESGVELVDLDLEECRIEESVLERAVWRRCSLDRCVLAGVNLSMAKLIDVRFSECTIRDSKAQAVSWSGLRAGGLAERSVVFERCRLDYGSFLATEVRGMRFVGCSLVDVDFAESDCRGVEFIDCDLSGARFSGADLRDAGFFDVRGLSLDVREARTLGLRVDTVAALDLVIPLGIRIVENPPTA